VEITRWRCNF